MGYYINILQQDCQYELDGRRFVFMQKLDGLYYFYVCKYDSDLLDYKQTDEIVSFSVKELNYIKRVQQCSQNGDLKLVGRDKVFLRN